MRVSTSWIRLVTNARVHRFRSFSGRWNFRRESFYCLSYPSPYSWSTVDGIALRERCAVHPSKSARYRYSIFMIKLIPPCFVVCKYRIHSKWPFWKILQKFVFGPSRRSSPCHADSLLITSPQSKRMCYRSDTTLLYVKTVQTSE